MSWPFASNALARVNTSTTRNGSISPTRFANGLVAKDEAEISDDFVTAFILASSLYNPINKSQSNLLQQIQCQSFGHFNTVNACR